MKHPYNLALCILFFINSAQAGTHVFKHVLDNGLTILVHPVTTAQKVSTQLWFNVGSKHEADSEKGLAHWLEHMCFKGTNLMSETDVRLTTAKLSGTFNATTSYDWTRFYLNYPPQHWFEALPILADMMSNCTFKQDLLNSEVQVVVQEMKNNRDNYPRQLVMQLISSAFPDHPYHYPVIGFRQDLESLTREKLVAFYKKHYVPNNAVLCVVGNVDPQEVVAYAQQAFGHLAPDLTYASNTFACEDDLLAKSCVLYRDVQKPIAYLAFKIPGIKKYGSIALEVFQRIMAGGRGSRLYRILIDQEQLVTSINAYSFDLFDADLQVFAFEPLNAQQIPNIIEIIVNEITKITQQGPELFEIEWAVQKTQSSFYDLMESNYDQADTIAKNYLATGNEETIFEYIHNDYQAIQQEIKVFAQKYLRTAVMLTGLVLPLPEEERTSWTALQAQCNRDDARLLASKKRVTPVEPPVYMHTVTAREPNARDLPKPHEYTLSNGLTVLCYQNDNVPKLNVHLQFKFDAWYEPKDKAGLCAIVNAMLLEGTTKRSRRSLMEELEKNGMGVGTSVGSLSMNILKEQCHKSFEIVTDIICNPLFASENLEKVKQQALAQYIRFWDTPNQILNRLIDLHIWGDVLPNLIGTPESITAITSDDLRAFHSAYYSPCGATLIIVGDMRGLDVREILERTLGSWQGPEVADVTIVEPCVSDATHVTHAIEREQVMLAIAGASIDRFDKDFYPLALFNQVLNKKLFSLREQTSAFYGIQGSALAGTGHRKGTAFIVTQVSQTRVAEAQELILKVVDYLVESFNEHDLEEAQSHIINSMNDMYSTNGSIAHTFLFLHEYGFDYNYFVDRIPDIKKVTVQEVRDAAKKVFNTQRMAIFKVGPVK